MKKLSLISSLILVFLTGILTVSSIQAQSLSTEIFAQRRKELMEKMGNGIAIFKSPNVSNRNSDISYPYRQDSDFYYLTGFEEPESAFLLVPQADKKFIMFVRNRNPRLEMWTGRIWGPEGAMEIFGADTAYTFAQFSKLLPRYLEGKEIIYYHSPDIEFRKKLRKMLKEQRGDQPRRFIKPLKYLPEMRLVKSPEEIQLMRKAINITCDAHIEAMRATEPGMYEYEIEAIIEYIFRKNGSPRNGFPSIVGSGPNSTIAHYDLNNRQTRNGDVLLMDIGAEYGYYSADVTRTIPVNGKFSQEQREIYEIVLEAQQKAIEMVAPGVGIGEVYGHCTEILKQGLYRLGLITDKDSEWQHRVWTLHGIGHWLGLDTHDVGGYLRDDEKGQILEPGMVFTVEPGIYFGENTLAYLSELSGDLVSEEEITAFIDSVKPVAEKYINIGIRIEDDVLVTEDGYDVLSQKSPKKITEIEKLIAEKSYLTEKVDSK